MKHLVGIVGVALLLGTAACSHNEKATETPVATTSADANYASQAQKEVTDLQTRLDNLRNASHSRKYGGGHARLRTLVNDQYAKLGEAKRELQDLQSASAADAAARRARLESTIAGIRSALDAATAE